VLRRPVWLAATAKLQEAKQKAGCSAQSAWQLVALLPAAVKVDLRVPELVA
jgi:hypothetical protein